MSTKKDKQDLTVKIFAVDIKYVKYSIEDFAQDLNFINWVKNGVGKKDWDDFVRENPNLSEDINTARTIVTGFGFNTRDIKKQDVYESYKDIESYYNEHHPSRSVFRFRKFMKYAAIFVLFFAVGAAIPVYYYFAGKADMYTEIASSVSNGTEAKLILSGRGEILLKEKHSDLRFNASGNQIKIDKDSIVNPENVDTKAMAQVIIPYGKRSSILLSDGTKVFLNAGSKLVFPQKFSGKNRKVYLKGEAFFDVFKNKEVPFIVSTDNINVTVHGTEFNVRDNNSENESEVVLVEGSVSLKDNSMMNFLGKETRLIPNQKAVYNKENNKTSVESNVDVNYYTSWKEGFLEFNRESILSVFKRLSHFYNVSFVTESSVELNRKISGKLDLKESLEDVMKVIADAAPITFRIEQNKILINSRISYLPMR